jgi:hypothetical protein
MTTECDDVFLDDQPLYLTFRRLSLPLSSGADGGSPKRLILDVWRLSLITGEDITECFVGYNGGSTSYHFNVFRRNNKNH